MTVAEAVTLIAALAAAFASVGATVASIRNGSRIRETHALVNGQSTRVEALARAAGMKEGEMVGRDHERAVGLHPGHDS